MTDVDVKLVVAMAVAGARSSERDRCRKAMCDKCANGVPLLPRDASRVGWYHDDAYGSPCMAWRLLDMPAEGKAVERDHAPEAAG